MDTVLAMLLGWLSIHSHYNIQNIPHPAVVELSPQDLTTEYYVDSPQMIPANGIDDRIQALYSWEDGKAGTIYILGSEYTQDSLSQETGLNNPLFQERLLHEIVHHIQYHSGEYQRFQCDAQGELMAYKYGGLFLQQNNIADPLPNRRILAHLYSRC